MGSKAADAERYHDMLSADHRDWLFRELRNYLELLAADGSTALAGVPDGCNKPSELALMFDNFRSAVVGNFAAELPPELLAALAGVDAALDRIPRHGWTDEAVRSAPEWQAVRDEATVAVQHLNLTEY
ncbi:MAG: hypothetical protein ABGY75_13270 [Gemmataceae bacterium]